MFSMKAKYGIRALLSLARMGRQERILIADLARKERIPKKFLEMILLDLRKRGILRSWKGKGGGYSLDRGPDAISLGEVIELFDGPLAPPTCASRSSIRDCDECDEYMACGLRLLIADVRSAISTILHGMTVSDLLSRANANKGRDNHDAIPYV